MTWACLGLLNTSPRSPGMTDIEAWHFVNQQLKPLPSTLPPWRLIFDPATASILTPYHAPASMITQLETDKKCGPIKLEEDALLICPLSASDSTLTGCLLDGGRSGGWVEIFAGVCKILMAFLQICIIARSFQMWQCNIFNINMEEQDCNWKRIVKQAFWLL